MIEACLPLFNTLVQKTIPIGSEPSTANLVKLSGNFLLTSAIEALGEAIALVSKAGVDARAYVEPLTSTIWIGLPLADSPGAMRAKASRPVDMGERSLRAY